LQGSILYIVQTESWNFKRYAAPIGGITFSYNIYSVCTHNCTHFKALGCQQVLENNGYDDYRKNY